MASITRPPTRNVDGAGGTGGAAGGAAACWKDVNRKISGNNCWTIIRLLSNLYQFQIDLGILLRRERDFARFGKIFLHGFGIRIFEPVRMIHGKNLVSARWKRGELKITARIGGLNPGRNRSMFRKCQDGSAKREVFQGDSSAEKRHVIPQGNFNGLRGAAGCNGKIGFQQICRSGSGGLHVQGAVGIDLEAVCSGNDILELERGSAAFPHLLRAVPELKQSGIAGHKLDMSGIIILLFPESFTAGSRSDDAHADGNCDGGKKDEMEAGEIGIYSKRNSSGQRMPVIIRSIGAQRVGTRWNPIDVESAAGGIKTPVIGERNAGGIAELEIHRLPRHVAVDRAGEAIKRLRGECEIDFDFFAGRNGNGSSGSKFGSSRVVDQRNALSAGLRQMGGENHRIAAGTSGKKIVARLQFGDAQISVFIGDRLRPPIPYLSAVLQTLGK